MARKTFDIAGYTVSLDLAEEALWKKLLNMVPFETESSEKPVLEVVQTTQLKEEEPEPLLVSDDEGFPKITVGKTPCGNWFFTMASLGTRPTSGRCVCSEDFSRAEFQILDASQAGFTVNNVMMLLYALRTSTLGCLEVHASVIMKEGKAVAFLGKSGTGKSTHSRLWLENIPKTELLNDDNPIIRIHPDGKVLIYGSPWSGKTPCYKKVSVPLAGVVRLSQAPFNKITRLSGIQAYACLFPSVSAYRPERKVADGIHDSIEKVAAAVPFFHLECLPDAEAAQLSFRSVYE